ncbi:hypothetical protein ACFE04_024234 [Oxalis oulophora]
MKGVTKPTESEITEVFLGKMLFHSSGKCGWMPISANSNMNLYTAEWFSLSGFLEELVKDKFNFDISAIPLNISFSDMTSNKEDINNACSRQLSKELKVCKFPSEVKKIEVIGRTKVEKFMVHGHVELVMATDTSMVRVMKALPIYYLQSSKVFVVLLFIPCIMLLIRSYHFFSNGEKCYISQNITRKAPRKQSNKRNKKPKEAHAQEKKISPIKASNIEEKRAKPSVLSKPVAVDQSFSTPVTNPPSKDKIRRRRNKKGNTIVSSISSPALSHAASANTDCSKSSFPNAQKSVHEKNQFPNAAKQPSQTCKTPKLVLKRKSHNPNASSVTKDKHVVLHSSSTLIPDGGRKVIIKTEEKNEKVRDEMVYYDLWGKGQFPKIADDDSFSFFVMTPESFFTNPHNM